MSSSGLVHNDTFKFDGTNYILWSNRMLCKLRALCPYIERFLDVGFSPPVDPQNLSLEDEKNLHLEALVYNEFLRSMNFTIYAFLIDLKCKSSHKMWTKLEETFGGSKSLEIDYLFENQAFTSGCEESSSKVNMCLMARGSKVTPTLNPNISRNDESDDDDEEIDDNFMHELGMVYASLRGNTNARAKFDFLMDTIVENKETIKDLKPLVNEGKFIFNLLKQELRDEKHNSFTLSQQIETHEIDKVKHLESIDRAFEMSQVLHASKKELEVTHASLTKDLEHLENAHKLLKDEINNLEEKYD